MTLIGTLWRRLRLLVNRDRATEELEDEMRLHRELRTEALERQGIPVHEAREEAARRLSGVCPHVPTIHPCTSIRWRAGYSDPSSTMKTPPDVPPMASAIWKPCSSSADRASVLRISMSSVPGGISSRMRGAVVTVT